MRRSILSFSLLSATLVLAGCFGSGVKDGPIQSGDTAFVTFTATYQGESKVFDEEILPLKIKIGKGDISPYIDDQLLGAMKGDTKQILVTPDNGFGDEYNSDLVKDLPAMYFTVGGKQVGMGTVVNLDGREGTVIGTQGEGDEQILTIDLNPQYTWKNIDYTIIVHQIGGSSFQGEAK